MCVFRYLKTPDIILSLVSLKKLDRTHSFDTHCIFETFNPFFKNVYNYLFLNSRLAETPKPWRINLLLETVYGGWTLILEQLKRNFQNSKDIQYGTPINLLENYLPLVLTIYKVTFKKTTSRNTVFVCFNRRHYNKAPLVWLSNTVHWRNKNKELYEQFSTWPTIYDEYPVENTHSVICAQTKPADMAEKLQQSKLQAHLTPPKQFNFSLQQLKYLKFKCAEFLTNIS